MKKILLLLTLLCCQTQELLAANAFDGILDPPTVTFVYPLMCETDMFPYVPAMTGTGNYLGGTFSAMPNGLNLSPQTGEIVPAMSAPGVYTVTYTIAASGPDPMVETTAQVIIAPVIFPSFGFPTLYCSGDSIPVLPTVSDNGIPGTWSPAVIDNQTPATYVFTPDAGWQCTQPFVLTININTCAGIQFNAYFDANLNGVKDNGEFDFPLGEFTYEKNNDGNLTQVIAPTGTYTINDGNLSDSYDVTFSIPAPYDTMYQAATTSLTDIFPSNPQVVYGFPVTPLQSFEDLQVRIVPVSAPRPGFHYDNRLIYANYGSSTVASGSVAFVKDPNVTVTAVSELGANITANGIAHSFTNLQPFETREILISMLTPTLPTIAIGQQLDCSASIAYGNGTVNDTDALSQTIIGAYDPNDKTEKYGPEIVWQDFTANDQLEYTIRFENTGTADAQNIRIVDVLDAKLDPATISFVASSHPCTLEKTGNQLAFVITNVQLPPSVPDTNIGKGFVTFRIKPTAGYALGDVIPNTASIYFDFNPAIVTEEWNTIFVAALATKTFTANSFVLYPNPANDVLNVRGNKTPEGLSVVIYDMLGKKILTETITGEALNIAKLEPGMYMVSITSGASKSIQKLIVK